MSATRDKTFEHNHSWQRMTIVHLHSGQPAAYQDHLYQMEVTFEGGTPANRNFPGQEIPFAIGPPFKTDAERGATVISGPSEEERRQAHDQHLKNKVRAFHGWSTDSTLGEPRKMGASWLETFKWVRGDDFSNTYLVIVKSPYMD